MGVALLKFRDALNTGADGVSFITAFGQDLIVENSTSGGSAGIASWRITLLQAPPGTARERRPFLDPVEDFVIGESSSGDTPYAVITDIEDDFYGCYRVMLEVWTDTNFRGTRDVDIRNVGIPLPNKGILLFPYQLDPAPLPLTGPGSKPDELNFADQRWGWSGRSYDPALYPYRMVNEALRLLDSMGGSPPNRHTVAASAGQTVFSLPEVPVSNMVLMVVDGITQNPLDYTVAGITVTYSGILLPGGATVSFYYWIGSATSPVSDELVKVSGTDPAGGYLGDKLASLGLDTRLVVGASQVQLATAAAAFLPTMFGFDSATGDGQPTGNRFRLNNASPASATYIYIDKTSVGSLSAAAWLGLISVGDVLFLARANPTAASEQFLATYTVSGTVIDATTYYKIPVTSAMYNGFAPVTEGGNALYVIRRLSVSSSLTLGAARAILSVSSDGTAYSWVPPGTAGSHLILDPNSPYTPVWQTARQRSRAVGFSGEASHTSTGSERIGVLYFDGSAIVSGTSVTFEVLLETSNVSYSAIVELYDVTEAAVVTGSTLTSTSLVPERKTATLTVPTNLPASGRVYEVHLRMSAENPGDEARCFSAVLHYTEALTS